MAVANASPSRPVLQQDDDFDGCCECLTLIVPRELLREVTAGDLEMRLQREQGHR